MADANEYRNVYDADGEYVGMFMSEADAKKWVGRRSGYEITTRRPTRKPTATTTAIDEALDAAIVATRPEEAPDDRDTE